MFTRRTLLRYLLHSLCSASQCGLSWPPSPSPRQPIQFVFSAVRDGIQHFQQDRTTCLLILNLENDLNQVDSSCSFRRSAGLCAMACQSCLRCAKMLASRTAKKTNYLAEDVPRRRRSLRWRKAWKAATPEDIRRVVAHCPGPNGKKRCTMFPQGAMKEVLDQDRVRRQPSVSLPWRAGGRRVSKKKKAMKKCGRGPEVGKELGIRRMGQDRRGLVRLGFVLMWEVSSPGQVDSSGQWKNES